MCIDCYKGYLTQKVGEGVESVSTVCPDEKCNMIVPQCLFKYLLNSKLYQKFKDYKRKSYIGSNRDTHKFCPGIDCDKVIIKKSNKKIFDV